MFHVVLIHACNMRKMHWHHAFHMHSHIVRSGVGAGYGLFISVGKWVMNSGKKWDRVQGRDSRVCK